MGDDDDDHNQLRSCMSSISLDNEACSNWIQPDRKQFQAFSVESNFDHHFPMTQFCQAI